MDRRPGRENGQSYRNSCFLSLRGLSLLTEKPNLCRRGHFDFKDYLKSNSIQAEHLLLWSQFIIKAPIRA